MADQPFAGQNIRNLIPVTDPRTHKLLGYRDGTGRAWTPDGKRSTDLPQSGGYGGYQSGIDQAHQNASVSARNAQSQAEKEKAAQAAKDAAAAKAQSTNNELTSQLGTVWVDGKEARVVGQDAKGLIVSLVNPDGSLGKASTLSSALGTLTAFDALNQSAIDPTTQFVMSNGAQLRADGTVMTQRGGVEHDSQVGTAPLQGQSRMTVGNALTWLANLSTKDPGAFQSMVDRLHKAHYLSDQDYTAMGATYDAQVGTAFSRLALDVASVNSTAGGATTSLEEYLKNKTDHPGPDPNAYKPVTRTFTDPNEIRAVAENAAQTAIGRRLTPQEQAALTAHFHGQESSMFDQIDAAGRQHLGASVTQPTATGAAYAEINDNPQLAQEQANFDMLKYGDVIKQLMGVQ